MPVLDAIKQATPWKLRLLSRRIKRSLREHRDARRSCEEVFTNIYRNGDWGGADEDAADIFYSGPGSSAAAAKPYIDAVRAFIATEAIDSVIDIGCGDFRVGQAIAACGVRYLGVDIVAPLIARNQTKFGSDTVRFMTGNVIEDDLPDAQLCLVREVFQHLSNHQIAHALARLRKYPFVLVTDYQPPPERVFTPNRDKPHGRDIRLFDNSALALDKPPFSLPNVEVFLDVASPNVVLTQGERLKSFLIRKGMKGSVLF
jgi:SAM-dependent methyltransferase